jgi:hypothetical protein
LADFSILFRPFGTKLDIYVFIKRPIKLYIADKLVYIMFDTIFVLGYGMTTDGFTTYINASTCTLKYKPVNPPIVFDFKVPEGHSKQEVVDLTIKHFGDQDRSESKKDLEVDDEDSDSVEFVPEDKDSVEFVSKDND